MAQLKDCSRLRKVTHEKVAVQALQIPTSSRQEVELVSKKFISHYRISLSILRRSSRFSPLSLYETKRRWVCKSFWQQKLLTKRKRSAPRWSISTITTTKRKRHSQTGAKSLTRRPVFAANPVLEAFASTISSLRLALRRLIRPRLTSSLKETLQGRLRTRERGLGQSTLSQSMP